MQSFIKKALTLLPIFTFLSACGSYATTEDASNNIATAKINAQLGLAYLQKQDVQRAKQKLLLALKEAPTIPETWYAMAYFQETTGNRVEAKQDYLKAIKLAPKRGDVQNNYGTFLCRSGQYKQAIQHFMLAVKDNDYLNPADAYENAGVCALKIPDREAAKRYFQQALREDPSLSISKQALYKLTHPRGV